MPYKEDFHIIYHILEAYFEGLHKADVDKLLDIFHEDTVLKAPGIRRTLKEWLELIASRPVPAEEGHEYNYRVLSVEVLGDQAMAKVYCPLLGAKFIDHLGLLRENDRWRIVNKMYADM